MSLDWLKKVQATSCTFVLGVLNYGLALGILFFTFHVPRFMNSDILRYTKLWQCVNILPLSYQVHRVLIPEGELKRRVPRRSLVLFYDPDDDIMITCLDRLQQISTNESKGLDLSPTPFHFQVLNRTYQKNRINYCANWSL